MTDLATSNGVSATAEHGLVKATRRERSLKGQASTLDSRAELLVKHVRSELDGIRETLDLIGAGQDEMLEVTPASVAANPTVAATLAPVVPVRSMITAHSRQQELEQQLAELTAQFVATKHELSTMREQHAGQGGRVDTLDQVIAALHENLQDLRAERKSWLSPGPEVKALPPVNEAD